MFGLNWDGEGGYNSLCDVGFDRVISTNPAATEQPVVHVSYHCLSLPSHDKAFRGFDIPTINKMLKNNNQLLWRLASLRKVVKWQAVLVWAA